MSRRCADAAPCQVIVAQFTFGVHRCNIPAVREVRMDGEWFRCCDRHILELGLKVTA